MAAWFVPQTPAQFRTAATLPLPQVVNVVAAAEYEPKNHRGRSDGKPTRRERKAALYQSRKADSDAGVAVAQ